MMDYLPIYILGRLFELKIVLGFLASVLGLIVVIIPACSHVNNDDIKRLKRTSVFCVMFITLFLLLPSQDDVNRISERYLINMARVESKFITKPEIKTDTKMEMKVETKKK